MFLAEKSDLTSGVDGSEKQEKKTLLFVHVPTKI